MAACQNIEDAENQDGVATPQSTREFGKGHKLSQLGKSQTSATKAPWQIFSFW